MMKELIVVASVILSLLAAGCTSKEVPLLTTEQKELAISSIENNGMVQDAAITQDGKKLSLALIVGYATNEATAKDLGDGFVRLVEQPYPKG